MEKEVKEILNHYRDREARKRSNAFLKRYWLSINEYYAFWSSVKDSVFDRNAKDIPEMIFNDNYQLIFQRGGVLFTKAEYIALQNCTKLTGDQSFAIIENEYTRNPNDDFPHLRFKFPVDLSWEQLNNGDELFPDISFEALYIANKHFFILGNSGHWGKYSASNYGETPIEIIGFKKEYAGVFKYYFNQADEEMNEIWEWLPEVYKSRINKQR